MTKDIAFFTIVEPDFANLFLATVAQVFASTLAIIFTVSALAITIAADRYSTRLLSRFISDPISISTFFALLVCMVIALLSIGVAAPMYQIAFLGMASLVAFSITLLLFYLHHTLQLIRPETFAQIVCNESIAALENQEWVKFDRTLTSLGDMVIKSHQRNEEAIAKNYLFALSTIHQAWVQLHPNKRPVEVGKDISFFQIGFGQRSPVFNQYKRVFIALVDNEDDTLLDTVSEQLADGIMLFLDKQNDTAGFRGCIKQYQEFLEIAIKHKSQVRCTMMRAYRSFIRQPNHPTTFQDAYLNEATNAFVKSCQIIVDYEDMELWVQILKYFCSGFESIQSLNEALARNLREIGYSLQKQNGYDSWGWFNRLSKYLIQSLGAKMTTSSLSIFSLVFEEIVSALPVISKVEQHVNQVRQYLLKLRLATAILDSFFAVGVYAYDNNKIDYVKKIWQDERKYRPFLERVPADVGFALLHLAPFISDSFLFSRQLKRHESPFEYCLLYFAYTLHRSQSKDWMPTPPQVSNSMLHRYGDWSNLIVKQIMSVYSLLNSFSYRFQKLSKIHIPPNVIVNSWNDIFQGQAWEAFNEGKNWFEDSVRQERWREAAQHLYEALPVAPSERIKTYSLFKSDFRQNRYINQIVTVSEAALDHDEIHTIERTECLERGKLSILHNFARDRLEGDVFKLVGYMIKDEIDLVRKEIEQHSQVFKETFESLNEDNVTQIVQRLVEGGHKPDFIMLTSTHRSPGDLLSGSQLSIGDEIILNVLEISLNASVTS